MIASENPIVNTGLPKSKYITLHPFGTPFGLLLIILQKHIIIICKNNPIDMLSIDALF
jgi:hypothetical protein